MDYSHIVAPPPNVSAQPSASNIFALRQTLPVKTHLSTPQTQQPEGVAAPPNTRRDTPVSVSLKSAVTDIDSSRGTQEGQQCDDVFLIGCDASINVELHLVCESEF